MSVYDWYLAIAALVTAVVAWRLHLKRSLLWIAWLAADFALSLGYMYLPKPQGPGIWWPPDSGVNMMLDATVAVMIWVYGKRQWETSSRSISLFNLMRFSVAVNLIYTTGEILGQPPIPPHEIYAIILEVINYLALLLICGTAILNGLGERGHHFSRWPMGSLRWSREALFTRHRPSEVLRKQSR